jgi:hypothetical protein
MVEVVVKGEMKLGWVDKELVDDDRRSVVGCLDVKVKEDSPELAHAEQIYQPWSARSQTLLSRNTESVSYALSYMKHTKCEMIETWTG